MIDFNNNSLQFQMSIINTLYDLINKLNNLLQMNCICQHRRYILELDEEYNYPFHGPKSKNFCVSVRVNISERQITDAPSIVSKLTEVSCENFIQIFQVLESNAGELNYLLSYEYIPFSLNLICDDNQPAHQDSQQPSLPVSRYELLEICKQLARLRIKTIPNPSDFGLAADNKLKFFLRPNFIIINNIQTHEEEKKYADELFEEYHYALTMGLKKKDQQRRNNLQNPNLSNLKLEGDTAAKIRQLRHNIFKVEMKTHENKGASQNYSNSEQNNSETSEKYNTTAKDEAGFHEERILSQKEKSFEDSLSCKQVRESKKKRTASFQLEKPRSESKYKKASWGEQTSTIVNSERASVLKQRISQALEKTQKTLTKYEKIKTGSSRRKKN